jgi:subtilisin family serine protease
MKKNVLLVFTIITVFVVLLFSFRSSLVSSSESNDFKAGIKKYDPRSVDSEHVEGEIIVKFKKDLSSLEQKRAVISSIGAKSFKNLDSSGHVRIRLSEGDTVEEALKRYAEDENVEYLEPNFIVRLALAPDDPAYPNTAPNGGQWGLKNVGQTLSVAGVCTGSLYTVVSTNPGTTGSDIAIESLWTEHTDCSSVVVAVIDTGIKYDHQDFIGNMWDGGASYLHHGWDFVNNDNNPMDDHNYAGSRGTELMFRV